MAEITGWFTMNGNHIPIINGESQASAAKRFLDLKNKQKRNYAKKGKTVTSKKYTKKLDTRDVKRYQDKLLNAEDELKSINRTLNNMGGVRYTERAISLRKRKAQLEDEIKKINNKGIY